MQELSKVSKDYVKVSVQQLSTVPHKGSQIGLGQRVRIILTPTQIDSNHPETKDASIIQGIEAKMLHESTEINEKKENCVALRIMDSSGSVKAVSVKIDRLADHLHLKPEVLIAKAREGKLEQFINTQQRLAEQITGIDVKGVEEKTDITEKKLMKIVKKAFRELEAGHTRFNLKDGKDFVAHLDEAGTLHLHKIESKSGPLGGGTFGVVNRAMHLNSQTSRVVKETSSARGAKQQLKNERKILLQLKHPAIQNPPHELIVGLNKWGSKRHYLIADFCERGSLKGSVAKEHFMEMTNEQKLSQIKSIMDGLEYMADKRVTHGDIKPDNMLMNGDGSIVFADFGGARIVPKESDENSDEILDSEDLVFTPGYLKEEDYDNIMNRMEEYNESADKAYDAERAVHKAEKALSKAPIDQGEEASTRLKKAKMSLQEAIAAREVAREKYLEARQKHDTYSTGVTLYEMLTGHSPPKDQAVDRQLFEQEPLNAWKDSGVIELLEGMLQPDHQKRLGPKEANRLAQSLMIK